MADIIKRWEEDQKKKAAEKRWIDSLPEEYSSIAGSLTPEQKKYVTALPEKEVLPALDRIARANREKEISTPRTPKEPAPLEKALKATGEFVQSIGLPAPNNAEPAPIFTPLGSKKSAIGSLFTPEQTQTYAAEESKQEERELPAAPKLPEVSPVRPQVFPVEKPYTEDDIRREKELAESYKGLSLAEKMGKVVEFNTPEGIAKFMGLTAETMPDLISSLADVKATYIKDREVMGDRKAKASFYSLLMQLAIGAYGIKNGVDVSGARFDLMDWSNKFNDLKEDYEREVALRQMQVAEQQRQYGRLREAAGLQLDTIRDRERAAEKEADIKTRRSALAYDVEQRVASMSLQQAQQSKSEVFNFIKNLNKSRDIIKSAAKKYKGDTSKVTVADLEAVGGADLVKGIEDPAFYERWMGAKPAGATLNDRISSQIKDFNDLYNKINIHEQQVAKGIGVKIPSTEVVKFIPNRGHYVYNALDPQGTPLRKATQEEIDAAGFKQSPNIK
jgi:hypothetical protein